MVRKIRYSELKDSTLVAVVLFSSTIAAIQGCNTKECDDHWFAELYGHWFQLDSLSY